MKSAIDRTVASDRLVHHMLSHCSSRTLGSRRNNDTLRGGQQQLECLPFRGFAKADTKGRSRAGCNRKQLEKLKHWTTHCTAVLIVRLFKKQAGNPLRDGKICSFCRFVTNQATACGDLPSPGAQKSCDRPPILPAMPSISFPVP